MRSKQTYFILISIISVALADAMSEQVVKEIKFGKNLICFVKEKNSGYFNNNQNYLDNFGIKEEAKKESFNISLPDVEMVIDSSKKLKITGNKRKRDILVQNSSGEIILNLSNKKQKKDVQSLGEEEIVDDIELQLSLGSSIGLGPRHSDSDSSAITKVTFDETINIISKNDLILPAVLSYWQQSQLVKIATTQPRHPADKGKIFLDDSITEIIFLDKFLRCNKKKEREKLLMELSIIDHVNSLLFLDKHGLAKKFDPNCNYFNEAKVLLERKINDSLEEAAKMIFSGKPVEVKWFGKIKGLSLKGQEIVEDALRRIIRPTPNTFSEWHMPCNVTEVQCHLDAMKAIINFQNDKKEIIDLKNGKILLSRDNVDWMFLDKTGMKAEIKYKNNRLEIVDIESKRVLFYRENVKWAQLNENYTRMVIEYLNGEMRIINLKNGKTFSKLGGNISHVSLGLSDSEASSIYYEDQTAKVINFEEKDSNKRVIYKENNIVHVDLTKDCSRIALVHSDGVGKVVNLENGAEIFKEDDIRGVLLDLSGEKIIVTSRDFQFKVIDLNEKDPDRRVLLKRNNIFYIEFSPKSKIIFVRHKNRGKVEIIDAENGRELLTRDNVKRLIFSTDDMIISILYKDGGGEIRYFTEKDLNQASRVLFEGKNIDDIALNSIGTEAAVWYKNKQLKIIDLENYNRDTVFIKLTLEELVTIFNLKKLSCLKKKLRFIGTDDLKKYCSLWILHLEGKKRLLDSYISKEVREFVES